MVGLIKIAEEYVPEQVEGTDLTSIKERIMQRILNINNYIRTLCDQYDRADRTREGANREADWHGETSGSRLVMNREADLSGSRLVTPTRKRPQSLEKYIKRNEFFVYSVSVTFNPKIGSISDLYKDSTEGDGVCIITAKLPTNDDRREFYLKLIKKCISKNSVMLQLKEEKVLSVQSFLASKVISKPIDVIQHNPVSYGSVPKYFDSDSVKSEYEDSEEEETFKGSVKGTYSFFNQSTLVLSKYAKSSLVPAGDLEDDKYVTQRLLKEKQRKMYEAKQKS